MGIVNPLLNQIVDFPAEQHNVHTEIEPQHNNHDSRKASVHIGKPFKNIHIYRKNEGCQCPPKCRKNSTRKLASKSSSPIRQKHVDAQRKYNQDNNHHDGSNLNYKIDNVLNHRSILVYEQTNTVTKSKNHKAQDNCQQE